MMKSHTGDWHVTRERRKIIPMMKKIVALVVFCTLTMLSFTAKAEDAPRLTVIELFTSQGCSSCPPADALLKTMRDRPGILTLSWAVDYWDRLGWKDTFGSPYNSQRQTDYNKRLGLGGVFTPQIILNGALSCVGSKPESVKRNLQKARDMALPNITPVLSIAADHRIALKLPKADTQGKVSIRVVWYLADASVDIMNGENNGRTLHYTNIVRATDIVDDVWTGEAKDFTLTAPDIKGVDHVAILLQQGYGNGPIIGATSLALPPAS